MRLHLFTLAYNLDKFLRRRLPRSISHGSSRTSQARFIKVYAKEIRHARYTCCRMAKV
ncbi:MAG: hypothetical protein IIA40_12700 [SAR324 cluster bacterium]|nr:hypothetical protein [SAR324 cluster bacterium]